MDHRWRNIPTGLIELEDIPLRGSREEHKVLVDPFAKEAIERVVPTSLRNELDGWARSYYTLETHLNSIFQYNRPKLPPPSHIAWLQTTQFVKSEFQKMFKVSAISYKSIDSVKWVRASAAGYGYQGLKGDGDNYQLARKTAFTLAEKLNHDRNYGSTALEHSTPDVAFTRTQLCQIKAKRKVRNVWGEAFHYVLLEGLFADPIIQQFMKMDTFYFIGKDPLLAVPTLIEGILAEKDYVYMFDWSGFDSSVQEWEIRFAFELLETLLVFPSSVEHQVWRFVVELFIYRKIAAPNGKIYLKTLGIPSGSCFTNLIGSITNYVRIQYLFYRLTNHFQTVYTHGDDSLAGVDAVHYIPMENFKPLCDEFNWTINLDKSDVSNHQSGVTFLSRQVREQAQARDELTCLRMLQFPEYVVETGAISALRAQSISKDAGINSHFLYLVFKHLKYKYGLDAVLPLNQKNWNPIEYESLRLSYSQM